MRAPRGEYKPCHDALLPSAESAPRALGLNESSRSGVHRRSFENRNQFVRTRLSPSRQAKIAIAPAILALLWESVRGAAKLCGRSKPVGKTARFSTIADRPAKLLQPCRQRGSSARDRRPRPRARPPFLPAFERCKPLGELVLFGLSPGGEPFVAAPASFRRRFPWRQPGRCEFPRSTESKNHQFLS